MNKLRLLIITIIIIMTEAQKFKETKISKMRSNMITSAQNTIETSWPW